MFPMMTKLSVIAAMIALLSSTAAISRDEATSRIPPYPDRPMPPDRGTPAVGPPRWQDIPLVPSKSDTRSNVTPDVAPDYDGLYPPAPYPPTVDHPVRLRNHGSKHLRATPTFHPPSYNDDEEQHSPVAEDSSSSIVDTMKSLLRTHILSDQQRQRAPTYYPTYYYGPTDYSYGYE